MRKSLLLPLILLSNITYANVTRDAERDKTIIKALSKYCVPKTNKYSSTDIDANAESLLGQSIYNINQFYICGSVFEAAYKGNLTGSKTLKTNLTDNEIVKGTNFETSKDQHYTGMNVTGTDSSCMCGINEVIRYYKPTNNGTDVTTDSTTVSISDTVANSDLDKELLTDKQSSFGQKSKIVQERKLMIYDPFRRHCRFRCRPGQYAKVQSENGSPNCPAGSFKQKINRELTVEGNW